MTPQEILSNKDLEIVEFNKDEKSFKAKLVVKNKMVLDVDYYLSISYGNGQFFAVPYLTIYLRRVGETDRTILHHESGNVNARIAKLYGIALKKHEASKTQLQDALYKEFSEL
jgi:hypothetical protein